MLWRTFYHLEVSEAIILKNLSMLTFFNKNTKKQRFSFIPPIPISPPILSLYVNKYKFNTSKG